MAEAALAEHEDSAQEESEPSGGGEIYLARHFRFDYNRPIPDLNNGRRTAYVASDLRFPTRELYALVLEPSVPCRGDVLSILMGQPTQNWLAVVSAGVFTIPGSDEQRFTVVLERPEGPRLWPSMSSPAAPIPELVITKQFMPMLAGALADLASHRVTHGAIRPDNLFYMDKGQSQVVLGECISEPAGLSQPSSFEQVDRAAALPIARGEGTAASDLYSLGVTLLALIMGQDPAGERDSEQLLMDKMIHGSFTALAGDGKRSSLSNHMRSLLKGLLADDASHRWTAEQVVQWCENPRIAAKRSPGPRRAPRPFTFASDEIYYAQILPRQFGRNPREAATAIRDGSLVNWLGRELHDVGAKDNLLTATEGAGGNDDELIALASMALQPQGALQFRDIVLLPDGLGPLLAEAMDQGNSGRLKTIADLIKSDLVEKWIEYYGLASNQVAPLMRTYGELKGFVAEQVPGFGLERCLYELNPSLPCRSPLIENEFVVALPGLMTALDRVIGAGVETENLIDRHIAAYMGARRARCAAPLKQLASAGDDVAKRCLAELSLLARVQHWEGDEPLYSLAAWWVPRLQPVIDTLHSKIRREVIARKLKSIAAKGDLGEMLMLIDGEQTRDRDEDEFTQAKREFTANVRELKALANSDARRAREAVVYGHQIAAAVGSVVFALTAGYLWIAGAP